MESGSGAGIPQIVAIHWRFDIIILFFGISPAVCRLFFEIIRFDFSVELIKFAEFVENFIDPGHLRVSQYPPGPAWSP